MKPPKIIWFNPGVENASGFHKTHKAFVQIENDLETLMLFTSEERDTVLLNKQYDKAYFDYLKSHGFNLPSVEIKNDFKASKKEYSFTECAPWGWGPDSFEFVKHKIRVNDLPEAELSHLVEINSKSFARKLSLLLCDEFPEEVCNKFYCGVECANGEGVENAIKEFNSNGCVELVAKAPYGTAGRGFKLIDKASSMQNVLSWCEQILKTQKTIIVEPWVERKKDFSILFDYKEGECKTIGVTEMIINKQGGYKGCWLNVDGLDELVSGNLFNKINQLLRDEFKAHVNALKSLPFSLDGFVFKDCDHKSALRVISEFNFRMSMGRVAHMIIEKVAANKCAMFRILNISSLNSADKKRIYIHHKMEINQSKWSEGICFLTPILKNTKFCAIMIVSSNKNNVLQLFDKLCCRYNIKK